MRGALSTTSDSESMCHVDRRTSWDAPEKILQGAVQTPKPGSESTVETSTSSGRPMKPFELMDGRVEDFRKKVLPEALTTFAEIFLLSGDRNAFFYTGSQAMHSDKIMIFEVGENERIIPLLHAEQAPFLSHIPP